ncbi:type II toxin-antitoxin system Phd/YefM family antitoxin [Limnobacter sp.]|uniref:type II toxin-antitoxin system Phd/YefM family antitoxin n=1 Tax=Limnobacter sp. TaxID=2003368 RepID=UPI00258CBA99|nr:type II toxin-antitoxin system Phd/YefM family antitoxin [Limnobacter sp.]
MQTVNMLQAKSTLSRLVEAIELGQESEILIARNGRPVAKLVPLNASANAKPRLGVAKGKFEVPESIDDLNDVVAALFQGKPAK